MDEVKMALLDLENGRFKDDRDGAILFLLKEWFPPEGDEVAFLQERLNKAEDDASEAEEKLEELKNAIRELLDET